MIDIKANKNKRLVKNPNSAFNDCRSEGVFAQKSRMLACRLCDWHLLCTAQHSIAPLGIPQPSCSTSPAALWVVQLELGEGWLSGESHSGPKPRCGYVLLCTAAGQKTDWEAWLSTSAPETVPSARDPAGQGGVGAGERLSCLTKNNAIRSRRQWDVLRFYVRSQEAQINHIPAHLD